MSQYTWIEILQDKWWIAVISLGVSLALTPVMRFIAYRARIVDRPDALLKPHGRPVAYLGGVAICVGLLAGLASAVFIMPEMFSGWDELRACLRAGDLFGLANVPLWNLLAVMLGSVVIALVGLLDDLRDIRPRIKVLGQGLAALILLVGGVGLQMATVFLTFVGLEDVLWVLLPASVLMCVVTVVLISNATNLLDGLDGLCGGVTGIIALGFLALAVWLAMWGRFAGGMDDLRIVLCLAMAGAVFGFLPYNAPPASIFMGDAGSMLLGFFVAAMMAMFCQEGNARWFIASLVVFALPILDTALAVVRRTLAGRSIFAGDRSHLYDQLVDRGWPVRKVVALFYALAAATAVLGVTVYVRLRYALILYAVLFLAVWVIFYRLGVVTPGTRHVRTGKRPINLLFTSAGRRVGLVEEFRRAAHDAKLHVRVHAVDHQPTAPALHVADEHSLIPSIRSREYTPALLDYCRQHEIDALVPLLDTELLPLAEARSRFAEAGTQILISSPEVVRTCMDKNRTAEFLSSRGFRTPRILDPDELEQADFPVFLKPRDGSSSKGAMRIENRRQLDYQREEDPESIVQELIEGVEYTVDVFTDFQGRPRCAVPRRRWEVRAGEVSKSQTVMHREMMAQSCRIVEELGGCRGMITIQCFLPTPHEEGSPAGADIVFIEINPRFGGGVPLSIRAGADSPRWILDLLAGREPDISPDNWCDRMYMLRYDKGIFVLPEQLPGGPRDARSSGS